MKYRADIDGLRAIAVLAVVIFHLNSKFLPGGFIGVDMFFVISGYLITSIIYKEMNDRQFCFKNFYVRRIKRILPTLFCVMGATLVVGFIGLLPTVFYGLGNSIFYVTTFISNFYFIRQGGYFEPSSHYPLLHTWSLSVEEQYYLIWPIILLVLFKLKFKPRDFLLFAISCMALSFISAEFISNSELSKWSYYLLPTRAGELLIGSCLAFIHSEKDILKDKLNFKNFSSIIGFILILLPLVFLNEKSVFPGLNAFWPTLGVALIVYGNPNSFVNKFLSSKPLVYIGLISYSMYLWHWPILAFMKYLSPYADFKSFSVFQSIIVFTVIMLVSILSYNYIEKPTRYTKLSQNKIILYYFILPSLLFISISLTSYYHKGFINRLSPAEQKALTMEIKDKCFGQNKAYCSVINKSNPESRKVLIYGDSHTAFFEAIFKNVFKDSKYDFDLLGSNGCIPERTIDEFNKKDKFTCSTTRKIFEETYKDYETIVIIGRWDYPIYSDTPTLNYMKKLEAKINKLSENVGKIIFIAQVPRFNIYVGRNELALKKIKLNANYSEENNYNIDNNYKKANEQIQKLAEKYDNVYFYSFNDLFYENEKPILFNQQNLPLYKDSNHMSLIGVEYLSQKIKTTQKYKQLKSLIFD